MVRNCFAPGCDSGYRSALARNEAVGKKNPSLFSAPTDEELLKKWIVAVRRKDKILTPKDKLCEKHFSEDCIVRTYQIKFPDGSVWSYDRGNAKLKPGAIPTIFAHSPKPTFKNRKRKTPNAQASMPSKQQKITLVSPIQTFIPSIKQQITPIPHVPNFIPTENEEISPVDIPSENEEISPVDIPSENEEISSVDIPSDNEEISPIDIPSENEEIAPIRIYRTDRDSKNQEIAPIAIPTFKPVENEEIAPIPVENLVGDKFLAYESFLSELDAVIKPNDLWVISHNSKFIICAKWVSYCMCERYVVVLKDLSVKIFLKNKEIAISDGSVISDIDDLSQLLMKVDKLIWEDL